MVSTDIKKDRGLIQEKISLESNYLDITEILSGVFNLGNLWNPFYTVTGSTVVSPLMSDPNDSRWIDEYTYDRYRPTVIIISIKKKTLKQWVEDNFDNDIRLKKKMNEILSDLSHFEPTLYEMMLSSTEEFTKEDLESLTRFIGAIDFGPSFDVDEALKVAEESYYATD